jgi:hypothetical protein
MTFPLVLYEKFITMWKQSMPEMLSLSLVFLMLNSTGVWTLSSLVGSADPAEKISGAPPDRGTYFW